VPFSASTGCRFNTEALAKFALERVRPGSGVKGRCGQSEDRAAVATGDNSQQTMDRRTIEDGIGQQPNILPGRERQALTAANYFV